MSYKGRALWQTYSADFVCFGKVIVEIKAVSGLTAKHRAQPLNHPRATGIRVGLLINFGYYPGVEQERCVI